MTAPTLAAAVTSLTDVAARWADAPDAGPQVLATLAALLQASDVEVVQGPPPEPSAVAGQWPLPGPDGAMGTVIVHRSAPLSADELVLTQVAAGLLVVQERRDARIRAMGEELEARLKALDRQRLFMERAVDSLPFGFYIVDRDYRIQLWNEARETNAYGVHRAEALGNSVFDVLQRQSRETLRQEIDEVFSTGRVLQFQMESDAYGELRTFRISKIPMRLEGEAVTHVITLGEDITDWRAARDRMAQKDKLAALGQLAAGVMHEINNPLATIAACAESLSALAPAPAAAGSMDLLRIVDLEVQRCKRIVDGLLDFSRPKPARRDPLDLNAVVAQTRFLLQHHPRFRLVELVAEVDAAHPVLAMGDDDQLMQVVMALAMNALDATPEGGRIVLRTALQPSAAGAPMAVVEVADSGPGIPRHLQDKVFEPFFTTKPVGQGTGLGLAICYGIVTDHGGFMELDSTEGHGATFRVVLPLLTASAGGSAA
ncbi:MAG: ATP-binding protein [Gemmatimonadaceae bacterium]